MINSFIFSTPTCEAQLIQLANKSGSIFIAGGTDLVPLLKQELLSPNELVYLGGLSSLSEIRQEGDRLHIGALVTLTELAGNSTIKEFFPAVACSAKCVASLQIRNMGTVGGNLMQDRRCIYFNQSREWRQSIAPCFKTGGAICHQAPTSPVCRATYYSDIATSLISLDATAELQGSSGASVITVDELCHLHSIQNGTANRGGILLKGITLYLPKGKSHNLFIKSSVRQSLDFPTFNAAGSITLTDGGVSVKLVAGAIAPEPVVLGNTSRLMQEMLGNSHADCNLFYQAAIDEATKNAVIIKEADISPSLKRDSFANIFTLICDILDWKSKLI